MIKSMTGYGKSDCVLNGDKYLVEIRSLNGKTADINIKTSLIPKDKEIGLRHYLSNELNRGTIDLFITLESISEGGARQINRDILVSYFRQIEEIRSEGCLGNLNDNALLNALLKMPDVVEIKKQNFGEEEWKTLFSSIKKAVEELQNFRIREGAILKKDITAKVDLIESYIPKVEEHEKERIDAVRQRILSRIEELEVSPDMNRLEQEIIFYIEKLDVNEEKVRLRQHCNYFRETMENEELAGKKLGFIAQEMGREINTLGSKANNADIQQWVVRMKDELEKIKEQSMNIL